MSFTFYTPINDAGAVLAAPHTAGDGHLVLDDASIFAAASPSPTAPVRVCAGSAIFKVVGIDGSTLLLDGTIEETTDISLPSGTIVENRVTAADIKDVHEAIAEKAPLISPSLTGTVTITSSVETNTGLIVQGVAGQSANFFEIQNNSDAILHSIDFTGAAVIDSTTANKIILKNTANLGIMPVTIGYGGGLFPTDETETVDHAFFIGWGPDLTPINYPCFTYNTENYFREGRPPEGNLEGHWNYMSKDRSISIRHFGWILDLNNHNMEYGLERTAVINIKGIGPSGDGSDGPTTIWDGVTGSISTPGTITAGGFVGSGSSLVSLSATQLATGTIPDGRFPSFLTIESGNNRLGVNTSNFTPSITNNGPTLVVNAGGMVYQLGNDELSISDGTRTAMVGISSSSMFIGSYTNQPINFRVNNGTVGSLDVSGNFAVNGSVTGGSMATVGTLKANSAGINPVILGDAAGSPSFPGIWFAGTPSFSNFAFLADGPGGGSLINGPTYLELRIANTGKMRVDATGIGFFGATPVARQSGDLATGLVALGLFSGVTVASATTISGSITESQVTNLVADLAAKAPLASPTFTGTVTATTITTTGKISTIGRSGPINSNTDGGTVTFDMNVSDKHTLTLGGNRTLAVSNDVTGQQFTVLLKQDGTGSRTVTWWSGIKWPNGVAPTLTTTADKEDVFTFLKMGSGDYRGFVAGQNF